MRKKYDLEERTYIFARDTGLLLKKVKYNIVLNEYIKHTDKEMENITQTLNSSLFNF